MSSERMPNPRNASNYSRRDLKIFGIAAFATIRDRRFYRRWQKHRDVRCMRHLCES